MALVLVSTSRCFGGELRKYAHHAASTACKMHFNVYLPPAALGARGDSDGRGVPWLLFLSGLTCTEDNFMHKAGALRTASKLGLALVTPDTSPRGLNVPGEADSWQFGVGAGFYLNATEPRWKHWRMYDYVVDELLTLVTTHLPLDPVRVSLFGHSMGGLGALLVGLRNPTKFKSVSAFAPLSDPAACPLGRKAFEGYLGHDTTTWAEWNPTALVAAYQGPDLHILIDQGDSDSFYKDGTLLPEHFVDAARAAGVPVEARWQPGYDHSYYFVSTFVDDHLAHHHRFLTAA